jgi:hypothetical protein
MAVTPEAGDPCALPDPPAAADPGGSLELVAAIHEVDLGEPGTGGFLEREVGFDLDKSCSASDPNTCALPDFATAPTDGPHGQDRAFAAWVASMGELIVGFTSQGFTATIQYGIGTMLLRVRGYNGGQDDSQVEVAMMGTTQFVPGSLEKPAWDGEDRWPVRSSNFQRDIFNQPDVNQPRYVDSNAYVRGGILVAAFSVLELELPIRITSQQYTIEMPLELEQVRVTAEIAATSTGYALRHGNLGGRLETSQFGLMVEGFLDPSDFTQWPLCSNSATYQPLKDRFCSFVDIHRELAPRTAPCDAISVGIAFEMTAAQVGDVQEWRTYTDGAATTGPCGAFLDTSPCGS